MVLDPTLVFDKKSLELFLPTTLPNPNIARIGGIVLTAAYYVNQDMDFPERLCAGQAHSIVGSPPKLSAYACVAPCQNRLPEFARYRGGQGGE